MKIARVDIESVGRCDSLFINSAYGLTVHVS